MLTKEKVPAALHAIHRILVYARWLTTQGADNEKLFKILDHAELLPVLLADPRDEDEFFQKMLDSLGAVDPVFIGVASGFKAGDHYHEGNGSTNVADVERNGNGSALAKTRFALIHDDKLIGVFDSPEIAMSQGAVGLGPGTCRIERVEPKEINQVAR
jgi:hypothetical protein